MASSRVMASTSPSHTASDLARFAQAASKPGGGGGSGLGSMNVEELLRGIYSDMPTPATASGSDRPMSPAPAPEIATRRTAEEVWKEITGGGGSMGSVAPAAPAVVAAGGGGCDGPEMTLEDFLAVKEDEVRVSGPSAPAEGQVAMGFLSGAGGVGGNGRGRGRKRQLMDPVDRALMQRQKRMIKNRESAARSRERKQAYIAELESLVTQLEEENAELLREQEERHRKQLKELMERVTPVIVRKKLSRDLRRTNSVEW
ncbi:bZIP transcription factor 12-like [Phragmites australis]|uniref:bZIP transcription factor 12-like n=1 Tax=Phragmites australis TaxID=29695 RepID=UPI002D782C85|nr:bZIP transcription factor 12-like [Phragmites australis]